MFGNRGQGGSGKSGFVNLTGLFKTKKGTGYTGFVKSDGFDAIRDILDEAQEAGTDVMFFVGSGKEGDKAAARLSMAVAQPRENAPAKPARGRIARPPRQAPKEVPKNPPADPLDKFLEEFDEN